MKTLGYNPGNYSDIMEIPYEVAERMVQLNLAMYPMIFGEEFMGEGQAPEIAPLRLLLDPEELRKFVTNKMQQVR